jgi:hypothetical protein
MQTARLILTGNHLQAVEKVVARADNLAESMWLKGEGFLATTTLFVTCRTAATL